MATPDYASMSNEELLALSGVGSASATPTPLPYFTDATGQGWNKDQTPFVPPVVATSPSNAYAGMSTDELLKLAGVSPSYSPETAIPGQLGKGLGFGLFNEFEGADAAARNSIANALGRGTGESFGDVYNRVSQARDIEDRAFEKDNPKSAIALQIGGAILPALATGGASLGGGATASLLKSLYGVGIKEAPTVGQLIRMGALGSGVAGFGNAKPGERLESGAIQAGVGAFAAPILGKATEYGTKAILNAISRNVPAGLSAQRGSISSRPATPGLTPEEIYLASQLKNTPTQKIEAGVDALRQAMDDKTPLFLPEAVNSPKVNRNARMIANNESSMEFAQTAINERAEAANSRIKAALAPLSKTSSTSEASGRFTKGAADILEQAKTMRSSEASPFYKKAFSQTPDLKSQGLLDLIEKDKNLTQAIKKVKGFAPNADKSNTSLEILHQAKTILDDNIEAAKRAGNNNEARLISNTRYELNEYLKTASPDYKTANEIFAQHSNDIDLLPEGLKILGKSEGDIAKVTNIFKESTPEEIANLRQAYIDADEGDAFNNGVRAYIQKTADATTDGRNPFTSLIGSPERRERIAAALGIDPTKLNSNALTRILKTEETIAKSKGVYSAGSSTQGNFAEAESFKRGVGVLSKIKNGAYLDAAMSLFKAGPSDEMAQNLARIYFDSKNGLEALNKIMPLLKAYEKNGNIAGALEKVTGIATGKAQQNATLEAMKPGAKKVDDKQAQKVLESAPTTFPDVKPTPKASPLKTDVAAYIKEQPELIRAVIHVESSGDPRAVSPTGPKGLMQLTKQMQRRFGVTDPFDHEQNVKAGTELLNLELKKWKDPRIALAAYNQGDPVISRAVRQAKAQGKEPTWENIKEFIPVEGRNYPLKVAKAYQKLKLTDV